MPNLAIAIIFAISAFTMSFAGYGFALVSVPLLAVFMPVREAVALQFPYCFALIAYQAWHYRKHFFWKDMKPMAAGVTLGIVIGTFLLYHLPGVVLKRALAVFIGMVVLLNLTPAGQRLITRYAQNPWWAHLCGFLSGSFLGAYSISGPPAALYILSVQRDPLRVKSFLNSFFFFQYAIIALIYSFTGIISGASLVASTAFVPVVAAGSAAGFFAFRWASIRVYHWVVMLILLGTSVALWWGA